MKIILVNYRYFNSGGPERYMSNIKQLLESNGHKVVPFSVNHNRNINTHYKKYFLGKIGSGEESYFNEYNLFRIIDLFKIAERYVYSLEAKRKFYALLKDTKPDLIYIIQYHNKISHSILDVARNKRIPVIHRISDYSYVCANALLYNFKINDVCNYCLVGSRLNSIKYKCVSNSIIMSLIKTIVMFIQSNSAGVKHISNFVVPSKHTIRKLIKGNFSRNKLVHIPSFYNDKNHNERETNKNTTKTPYALYIGRIEKEKGVEILIEAFQESRYSLKIIGYSKSDFEKKLKQSLIGKDHDIEFIGKLPHGHVMRYLSNCLFTIVPSLCYDNFPNVVLESFKSKKPVVCSKLGSLAEIVVNRHNGALFNPGNTKELVKIINYFFTNVEIVKRLGENAYHDLTNRYSSEQHYEKLMTIFHAAIQNNLE